MIFFSSDNQNMETMDIFDVLLRNSFVCDFEILATTTDKMSILACLSFEEEIDTQRKNQQKREASRIH
jgi:hypothetical protein